MNHVAPGLAITVHEVCAACPKYGRMTDTSSQPFQQVTLGMRVAVLDRMTIVPLLVAALLVVGVALFGIITSGGSAADPS